MAKFGFEVHWAVEQSVQASDRGAMGWPEGDREGLHLHVDPDPAEIARLLDELPEDSLHVFLGIHGFRLSRKAFLMAMRRPRVRAALMSEPPWPYGRLVKLRPLWAKSYQILFGRRIEAILGIGWGARDFYKGLGYAPDRIFAHAYTPPAPELPLPTTDPDPTIFFVGSLEPRKGPDLLVQALGILKDMEWRAVMVGGGPMEPDLRAEADRLGIAERIDWRGFLPNHEAMDALARSRVAVLPSRHDGWGVVTNEALMRGVPVVATDRCHSSELLVDPLLGRPCPATPDGLAQALRSELAGSLDPGRREAIAAWSERFQGPAVAAHVQAQLARLGSGEPPPPTPWLDGKPRMPSAAKIALG